MDKQIVCFGEVLLRLASPRPELLLQSSRFEVSVGGAEANVAAALALWGHRVTMLTVLPDNALGQAALAELRRHGVATDRMLLRAGRMGLYFLESGALHRSSEILYDRAHSAFAAAAAESFNWDRELAGARWLHISGVTPALGAAAARATTEAMRSAIRLGVSTSFDCNHRAKLWNSWQGDARAILGDVVESTDVLFGNERDIALLLGTTYDSVPAADRAQQAVDHAFESYPRLTRIYKTTRLERSVDDHQLTAQLFTRDRAFSTGTYTLAPIVDRIGSGDAFAAGAIHGIISGMKEQQSLDFALAAACLKHSIPGDLTLVRREQVEALIAGHGFSVKR